MEHQRYNSPYARLLFMAAFSFAAMYGLMYAMVDDWSNVYGNLNQAYMAGLMTAPMVLIELWLMRAMYPHRRLNVALALASVAFGVVCFAGIRAQTAISDEQFVRSMIPHHAGAILMCEKTRLENAELQELCARIIEGQQAEIHFMRGVLQETRQYTP